MNNKLPVSVASYLERFLPVIMGERAPQARDEALLIERAGSLAVYYSPFESINPQARIVLVGITPGPTQMTNSLNALRGALLRGGSKEDALACAKSFAAFSGEPMRTNLIRQLSHWGVQQWLDIPECSALFTEQAHLVHSTSLLRNPVFLGETGYNGAPDMMRQPVLRAQVFEQFVPEIQALQGALILGLGPKVHAVLDRLSAEGQLGSNTHINGILHPSGQNTYRVNYLIGDQRADPPHMTNCTRYNAGRQHFQALLNGRE